MGLIPGHKPCHLCVKINARTRKIVRKGPGLLLMPKLTLYEFFMTLSPGVRLNLNFATFPGSLISLFRSKPFSPPSVEHQTMDSWLFANSIISSISQWRSRCHANSSTVNLSTDFLPVVCLMSKEAPHLGSHFLTFTSLVETPLLGTWCWTYEIKSKQRKNVPCRIQTYNQRKGKPP